MYLLLCISYVSCNLGSGEMVQSIKYPFTMIPSISLKARQCSTPLTSLLGDWADIRESLKLTG